MKRPGPGKPRHDLSGTYLHSLLAVPGRGRGRAQEGKSGGTAMRDKAVAPYAATGWASVASAADRCAHLQHRAMGNCRGQQSRPACARFLIEAILRTPAWD